MPNRTDDLPPTKPSAAAELFDRESGPPSPTVPVPRVAPSPAARPALPTRDDDHPHTHESFRAICSSNQRGGNWEPADEIEVLSIAGEVVLDFTRAELPESGVIEIDALSICGEIKIIVPDGSEVDVEATPFLGSIEHEVRKKQGLREGVASERDEDLPAQARSAQPPYFRIEGHAIMGTIKVTGR